MRKKYEESEERKGGHVDKFHPSYTKNHETAVNARVHARTQ
jgi:hypothetical protein